MVTVKTKDGEFIAEYKTYSEARDGLGITGKYANASISACCCGKVKSVYGYVFEGYSEVGRGAPRHKKRMSSEPPSPWVDDVEDSFYIALAKEILKSANDYGDLDFLNTTWCETLCDFFGVDRSYFGKICKQHRNFGKKARILEV